MRCGLAQKSVQAPASLVELLQGPPISAEFKRKNGFMFSIRRYVFVLVGEALPQRREGRGVVAIRESNVGNHGFILSPRSAVLTSTSQLELRSRE